MRREGKRLLSIFLSICMLFGLLPGMPVYAEEEVENQEQTAVGLLATDYMNWDQGFPVVHEDAEYTKDLYTGLTGTTVHVVYKESAEAESIEAGKNQLSFTFGEQDAVESGKLEWNVNEGNEELLDLRFNTVGDYTVTYSGAEANNTMTIHVGYPELGFYAGTKVVDTDYLRQFFYPDVNENTFYMVPSLGEGCSISENSLSFRVMDEGNEVTENLDKYFTKEEVSKNVYRISVTEQKWIDIIVSATIKDSEGHSWYSETWVGTEYRKTKDGLVVKDWIEMENDVPFVNPEATYEKECGAALKEYKLLHLAYLEEEDGEASAIDLDNISVSCNGVSADETKVSYSVKDSDKGIYEFKFSELGEYVITYTAEGAKNNSVTVYVGYPEVAFYSGADKETADLLTGEVQKFSDLAKEDETTFYLILYREGGTISLSGTPFKVSDYRMGAEFTEPGDVEKYITYEEVGDNVYKIVVKKEKSFGLEARAVVVAEDGASWEPATFMEIEYVPKKEGLVASWPMWTENGPQMNPGEELHKEIGVDLNRQILYLGYLESEEDETPVAVSANDINVTCNGDEVVVDCSPNGGNPELTEFVFPKTGEYTITYPDGAVSNKIKVYVDYPMAGLYKTDEISEDNFIRDEFVYSDENNSCYLLINKRDQEISDVKVEVLDYFADAAKLTTVKEGEVYKITLSNEALFRAKISLRCVWPDGNEEYPEYEIEFRHKDFTGKKAYTDGKAHTGYVGCYISKEEYEKGVVYYNDNNAMYWVHADTVQGVIDKLSKVANGEEVLYKESVEYDTGIAKPDTDDTTEGIDIINTGYIHVVASHHGNVELEPQYVSSSGNMKGINFVSGQDVYMTVHDEVDGIFVEDRVYDLNMLRDSIPQEEAAEIIPESLADTQFVSVYLGEVYHVNHVVEGNLDYFTLGEKITYDDGKEADQKTGLTQYLKGNDYAALMEPFMYPEMHVNIYCDMKFGGRFEKLSIGFKEGYDYSAAIVNGSDPENYEQYVFTREDLDGQKTKAENAVVTYWDGRTESGYDEDITVWLYDINSETTTSGSFTGSVGIEETPEPNAMTELTQEQKDAIEQSNKLTVDMKADSKTETQVDDEVENAIKEAVKDENADGTYYVDLSVTATVEGVEGTTNITEVKAPMDVTIDLPDDMRKKGRKFHVVRHHKKGGKHETHKLDCHVSSDGGKIHFKTDRFSTYAIVYEDEEVVTPPQTPVHTHTPGEWTVVEEATGKKAGLKQKKCTTCGEVLDSEVIPKFVVKLNVKKVALQKGKSTTAIKATVMKGDKIKSWKSSDKKVATVNSKGKITAKKVGKATITVTTKKGAKATVTVTVQKKAVKCTKIAVDKKKITLKVKKSYQLKVTKTPVTTLEKVTYKSSNTKVATVSKTGKIKAKKAGKATITVKCGKKTVKVKVTVKKK